LRAIARLGGFLARKNDGSPGWITIWRGWRKLMLLTQGFELAKGENCG
ncbi:MAG: IS4 family transposase, partial [Phycisphaerae bacterium]|nr:IS4 family transposase [Phycisphaerae bacterium]